MLPKVSLYHRDWLKKADKDLERVPKLIELSKGRELKRVHDLEDLLDSAVEYNTELENYRSVCQRITEYFCPKNKSMFYAQNLNQNSRSRPGRPISYPALLSDAIRIGSLRDRQHYPFLHRRRPVRIF